ncbi:MAG: response regulator [Pirellulaceae bacterium]
MLLVSVENVRQRVRQLHDNGPLVLGRLPGSTHAHLSVDDPAVCASHLRIEEISATHLRVDNLADVPLALPGGDRLAAGGATHLPLPVRLNLGNTHVEVVGLSGSVSSLTGPADVHSESSAGDHRFQSLSVPALNPLGFTRQATLASLGAVPSVEKLAEWFETLLSVQRAAVGSTEFYRETARALVELVGLDRGLVLLREGEKWRLAAGHNVDARRGLRHSNTIVNMVAEQARTFYGNPQGFSLRTSLANVEALVASPVLDAAGAVVGILYGSRDVTPAKPLAEIQPLEAQVVQMLASSVSVGLIRLRMQDQLRQVEQLAAVGQAIGFIVHDLRGPLGNAQMLLEMLRGENVSLLTRDQQLEIIETSLSVCRALLDDSLEFCRGCVRVAPVRGTFRELFERHLQLLRMDLDALQVTLSVDVPDDLVVVLDPDRMARVLRNLAKNAAEACRGCEDARVTLGARGTTRGCELWVEDNGPGLPPEVQAKLFQPFGTHGKRGGTGFGLAIAKQLVEAHHGGIAVASSPNGTRFTLTLPAEPPGVESPVFDRPSESARQASGSHLIAGRPDSERSNVALRPLRVLLAEDGLVNQRLATAMLERAHHSVTVAANGREAIAALGAQTFDLILMDQEMPEMDGLEATARIREQERLSGKAHIPILALTANALPGDAQRCLDAGMDGYLSKPLRAVDLHRALAELALRNSAPLSRSAGPAELQLRQATQSQSTPPLP